jgi:hypothetical protein
MRIRSLAQRLLDLLFVVVMIAAVGTVILICISQSDEKPVQAATIISKAGPSFVSTDKGSFRCSDPVLFERLEIGKVYHFRFDAGDIEWDVLD